jgi:hypothetical protein
MNCVIWRDIEKLIATGKDKGFNLLALCMWNKTNGWGGLCCSWHQLVAIFKNP